MHGPQDGSTGLGAVGKSQLEDTQSSPGKGHLTQTQGGQPRGCDLEGLQVGGAPGFSAHVSPALQAAWPSGTECIAKYNFHGTAEQDLPFCKGDVLTIVAVTKVTRDFTPLPTSYLWVLSPLHGRVSLRACLGSPLPRTPTGIQSQEQGGP